MINVTIHVSEDEVKRRLGALAGRSGAVIARAANRSVNTGKKAIKQETAKIYNVRQKDVDGILKVTKATAAKPVLVLTYKDKHPNLYVFGSASTLTPRFIIQSSDPVNPDPEYVKAKVMKGHGYTPLKGRPKPFVQQAKKTGNIALFQRTSDDPRSPIRGVAAPALPQVIKNDEVLARFNRDAGTMFQKRLKHEIENILKGTTQ
ncbi:MAG: phage tail protein [Lachnospiraceae bacterium]|nr:phage tail protein [Lachnospiraceae bacterium]MBO5145453.1 phage tail protein [Lachnospiraceae bacterium]